MLTISYLQPLEIIDEVRPRHLAWLDDEISAGRLLLAGRQESQTGGVLITADISTQDALELIDRDPYLTAGLVQYDRLSFTGGIRAPGL